MNSEELQRGIIINGPVGHIGHTDHNVSALTRQSLADKGMNDVIVVDGNNVAEIRQRLERDKFEPLEKFDFHAPVELPPLSDIATNHVISKKHKPNKGITLGSYKFTSKK